MNLYAIDINCDVGEGIGNESLAMPFITSCNIACGAHAGSKEIVSEVINLATKYKVHIGAHPSYPDRDNFGRKTMPIELPTLQQSLEYQIELVLDELQKSVATLNHIKPHGALYNDAVKDEALARCIITAMKNTVRNVWLYAPHQSVLAEIALQEGIRVKYEAFIDRHYMPDMTLVSRSEENAVITDSDEVLQHLLQMVQHQSVICANGEKINITANTYCLHGDNPKLLYILRYLHKKLPDYGIKIA